MKIPIIIALVFALLMLGCSEAGPTEAPPALTGEDTSSGEALDKRGASGKVKAPAAGLEVEILESNSDFINHIYLVHPGPALFIGTDDATGTVTALPPVRRGQELLFEIRVHDPSGVVRRE